MKRYNKIFEISKTHINLDTVQIEIEDDNDFKLFEKLMKKYGYENDWQVVPGDFGIGGIPTGIDIRKDVYLKMVKIFEKYNIQWEEL